jgi:hypothetical protein
MKLNVGKPSSFNITNDGVLKTKDERTVVPNDSELRRKIIEEAHKK